MLSDPMLSKLSTYSFRCDAKSSVCIVPLGSIYWEDEMPDIRELVNCPEGDRETLLRLFAIRMRIWDGKPIDAVHQALWDAVRFRVPSWALFHRLELSPDDWKAREEAERHCLEAFAAFTADADKVELGEEDDLGIQRFSATFNLKKEPDPPKQDLWKRLRRILGMAEKRQLTFVNVALRAKPELKTA